MKFVDRDKEQQRLKALLGGEERSLVMIRGRRRIGKSTLVAKVLKDSDIYFEADRTAPASQRAQLSGVIARHFPGFDDALYKDWRALLTALNYRVQERITLCLDEFPYLVEGDPALPSIIQGLLVDKGNPLKFNLILCGSSQQMMYNLTHDATAPLFGRANSDLSMKPISVKYLQEALELDPVETIENFAVWGGVPRYWLLRESSPSLYEAITTHVLSDLGALYEEPQHLFKDDIRDPVKTSTIMSIVGNNIHRLSEIASRCEEPATNLSRPLAKLVSLGYLEKETPFGESPKSSKRSLYQIADPFLSFYFKFVPGSRSFIELGRMEPVLMDLERGFPGHVGYWWEHICRDAVTGNVIDGVRFREARRWWGKIPVNGGKLEMQDIELDIVAESEDGSTLLVGECKWTSGENGRLLTNKLEKIAHSLPFARGKKLMVKLFTKTIPEDDQGNVLLPADVLKMM